MYSDDDLRKSKDLMTVRNLDALLALPEELRSEAFAESIYVMNCIGGRPSDALAQAIRTVRASGGRPHKA